MFSRRSSPRSPCCSRSRPPARTGSDRLQQRRRRLAPRRRRLTARRRPTPRGRLSSCPTATSAAARSSTPPTSSPPRTASTTTRTGVIAPSTITVHAGITNRFAAGQHPAVTAVSVNPDYDPDMQTGDVAILTLATPFTFGPTVKAIGLTDIGYRPGSSDGLRLSGWGSDVARAPDDTTTVPHAVDNLNVATLHTEHRLRAGLRAVRRQPAALRRPGRPRRLPGRQRRPAGRPGRRRLEARGHRHRRRRLRLD